MIDILNVDQSDIHVIIALARKLAEGDDKADLRHYESKAIELMNIIQEQQDIARGIHFAFKRMQKVRKTGGSYELDGVIRARFCTKKAEIRYVVDHEPVAPGLLHIYSEAQLRAI